MTDSTFDLVKLLSTVFQPIEGLRVCILIDLDDPSLIKDFAYLEKDGYPVQKHAYHDFYQTLKNGGSDKLGLTGGDIFAYKTTGGSNLELPDTCMDPTGAEHRLDQAVYPEYGLILCISDYSATAPLTSHAKKYGFRGSTMHGVNDVILASGLSVDYTECSAQAEKLRLGMTKADAVEIDTEIDGRKETLRLQLDGQEAQKSHGLCWGTQPDIANLPAGEVYFVPHSADGCFPIKHEDGTITYNHVKDGNIVDIELVTGNADIVTAHKAKIASDPITGRLGELGFGTQTLPFADADIQDEKVLGTVHVATGRSDHLGGDLTPDLFAEASNATHDDLLLHPQKTPEIQLTQVRMYKGDKEEVLIENYAPAAFMTSLISGD